MKNINMDKVIELMKEAQKTGKPFTVTLHFGEPQKKVSNIDELFSKIFDDENMKVIFSSLKEAMDELKKDLRDMKSKRIHFN